MFFIDNFSYNYRSFTKFSILFRHWRHCELGFNLLKILIRHDIYYPKSAVELFAKNLINEKESIRKIAIELFPAILYQMKANHPKRELKTLSNDNLWLQTDPNFALDSEETFDSIDFIDKAYKGFYAFENAFLVYDKNKEYSLRELKNFDSRLKIQRSFCDSKFLIQLLSYLTLEEEKGNERMNYSNIQLWKRIYRNYKLFNMDLILPKLNEFVSSSQDCYHRCAAEIIEGIIQGSKYWTFDENMKIEQLLKPLVKKMFCSLTSEIRPIWGPFSADLFSNRDPRRTIWLLRTYLENTLEEQIDSLSSFDQSSRLCLLHAVLYHTGWRALKISQELLNHLEDKHLSHSYHDLRVTIGRFVIRDF